MKNLIAIFSIVIILSSCKDSKVKNSAAASNADTLTTKTFAIDSVKVADSAVINKNLTSSFTKQLLVFPSIKNKAVLDSIYKVAGIKEKSYDKNSLKAALTKQMQESFAASKRDSQDWTPEFKQNWDETSTMKLVSLRDNVLTLLYTGSGFTGGAHGYFFERYKVFDLNKNKVITLKDLFINPKDPAWDGILRSHFEQPEQKEMLLVDQIMPNSNFFFDDQKITFVYNQYEIAAYAAGVVYITINFSEIKNKLKPEFVTQYKIK